jgi:hypothetical protein
MYKSEQFQTVEKLIEMKAQMRRLTGMVETIEETIALWRQADKLDEYWDTVWAHPVDGNSLATGVAILKADLELLEMIAPLPHIGVHFLGRRLIRGNAALKEELVQRSLRSTLSVKEKIVRLQAIARKCQVTLNQTLAGNWRHLKRRDSRVSLPSLEIAARDLVLLEAEIEECWAQIWRGPSTAWSDSLNRAWSKDFGTSEITQQ